MAALDQLRITRPKRYTSVEHGMHFGMQVHMEA
jgi:hypothetical protein